MAGEYVLRMKYGSRTVESIIWDGQDYTDRPFDASTGRDISGVVVTLSTTDVVAVGGVVTDNGAPVDIGRGGDRFSSRARSLVELRLHIPRASSPR